MKTILMSTTTKIIVPDNVTKNDLLRVLRALPENAIIDNIEMGPHGASTSNETEVVITYHASAEDDSITAPWNPTSPTIRNIDPYKLNEITCVNGISEHDVLTEASESM